jgi:hypothetical protein
MESLITLTFPKRLAIAAATSIDAADMILVVKNREPNFPSSRPNLLWKKSVTQDLVYLSACSCYEVMKDLYNGTRPDAKESSPNNKQRLSTITLLSGLICGSHCFGFSGFTSSAPSPSRGAVSGSSMGVVVFGSISTFLLRAIARRSFITPHAAYPQNIAR